MQHSLGNETCKKAREENPNKLFFVCLYSHFSKHPKEYLFFSVAQLKWLGYMEISHPTLFSHPQSIKDVALSCTNKRGKKSILMGRL